MGAARLSMALCLKLESSVNTSAMWRLLSCIWPSPVNSTATVLTLGLCKAKPAGTPLQRLLLVPQDAGMWVSHVSALCHAPNMEMHCWWHETEPCISVAAPTASTLGLCKA